MKYVMIQVADQRLPITFTDQLNHIDVAKAYLAERRHSPGKVVSAGFVNLDTFETFGRSESLDLEPRPEDSLLIRTLLTQGEGMLMWVCANLAKEQETVDEVTFEGGTVNVRGLPAPSPANEQINHDSDQETQSASDSLGGSEKLQPAGSAQ